MAVFGAFKFAFVFPFKRPRNDARNVVRLNVFESDFAQSVQFIQAEVFFVRGNLKNAICRRITNGFAGFDMFFAKFFNNSRAGSGFVA